MTDPIIRSREDSDLESAGAALVDVHRTDGYPVEGVAVIGRLFVKASVRRQSIGQQLSRAVVTDEAVRGKRLVLDVMDKDQDAIRLYERLGLKRIGTAIHTFGEGQTITASCYVVPEIG
jgi:ribosomal protein S18 acetylase RimI-like enzyme